MFATDRRTLVAMVAAVLVAGIGGAVVANLLGRANVQVPIAWAAALGATVVVLILSLRTLTRTLDVPLHHGVLADAVAEIPAPLLTSWERRLGAASRDRRQFLAGLRPQLADLARERIRLHHALDLDLVLLDPRHAQTILGNDLWLWLTTTDHDGPPPQPGELQALITAIQAL